MIIWTDNKLVSAADPAVLAVYLVGDLPPTR